MQDLQLETASIDEQQAPPPPALTPRSSRSLRAYRHGLTGQIVLLTEADRLAYEKHCQGYHRSLDPHGALETDLCQQISDDRWRLKRAASLEAAVFAARITQPDSLTSGNDEVDATLAMGQAWIERGASLQLLTLYESRIQRRFEKNMAEFRALQQSRKAALDQALEEADLLAQLAESKGEDPGPVIGAVFVRFDFSSTDAARLLLRYRNLREARKRFQDPKKRAA